MDRSVGEAKNIPVEPIFPIFGIVILFYSVTVHGVVVVVVLWWLWWLWGGAVIVIIDH